MHEREIHMKKTTKKVLDQFPVLRNKLQAQNDEKALSSLLPNEKTFLQLIWFFEDPSSKFDLSLLYLTLEGDWLEFALECISTYFQEDTYLIPNSKMTIIKEGDEYLNQAKFADYLSDQGLEYSREKLHVYYKRGVLPNPDVYMTDIPYWKMSTVEAYCHKLLTKKE